MVAAEEKELAAQEDSSSADSSAVSLHEVEPAEEVRQLVEEEIADACMTTVVATDQYFVNLNNSKIHRGRQGDASLTACGNPIGSNIMPMASGEELDEVSPQVLCMNCFGRSLEQRRVVAMRLSETTEPLACDLRVK